MKRDGLVLCNVQPTLRLQLCERDRLVMPAQLSVNVELAEHIDGRLTVFGLVKLMSSCRQMFIDYKRFSFQELEVLYNLRTKQYTQFSTNLLNHLLPCNMHKNRHVVNTRSSTEDVDLPSNFLKFYNSFRDITSAASRDYHFFQYG